MKSLRVRREGAVAIIELFRPDKLNALDLELKSELAGAIAEASENQSTRAVVLTGAGRAFCAGADLSDLQPERGLAYRDELRRLQSSLVEAIIDSPKPFVAAVNGPAVGGGFGLALACDLILAAESAYFEAPVVRTLGIAPDFGLAFTLQLSVGLNRARSVLLFGDRLGAEAAFHWGLVHKVTPAAELLPESISYAQRIAGAPPRAVAGAKRLLRVGASAGLRRLLEAEADEQTLLRSTRDHSEAVSAFLEGREPFFTDD